MIEANNHKLTFMKSFFKLLAPENNRENSIYARPNQEEEHEIKRQWVNGNSLRRISENLSIGWQRVRKSLITSGIYNTDLSSKINNMYREGMCIDEIADNTGLKKSCVYSYLPYAMPEHIIILNTRLMKLFEAFLEHSLEVQEKSISTIKGYRTGFLKYTNMYKTLSLNNMRAFRTYCYNNYKHSTANRYISTMNMFCKYLGLDNLCVKVERLKKIDAVENVISESQYKRLLAGLKADGNLKGYYIVMWISHTGVRPSDLLSLEKSCLTTQSQYVVSKGMRRIIYIPPELIRKSKSYFDSVDNELLFPNKYGNKMSVVGLNGIMKYWAKKYDIPKEVMHPYSFRHFFAKQFLRYDGDILLLADLMGHWNIDTTRIYARKSKNEQLEEYDEIAMKW